MKNIVIIQGHPDNTHAHFGHALAQQYLDGAHEAGHQVQIIQVARLDFPWLKSDEEFEHGEIPPILKPAQQAIEQADHLVFIYPLWLGDMPAILKAFLEQVFRPGFAIGKAGDEQRKGGLLKGKTARIVVTMGMPAFIYRWFYGAHSLKSFKRNILKFSGIKISGETLIGFMGQTKPHKNQAWLDKMQQYGKAGN